jgi:hypothetical protein
MKCCRHSELQRRRFRRVLRPRRSSAVGRRPVGHRQHVLRVRLSHRILPARRTDHGILVTHGTRQPSAEMHRSLLETSGNVQSICQGKLPMEQRIC